MKLSKRDQKRFDNMKNAEQVDKAYQLDTSIKKQTIQLNYFKSLFRQASKKSITGKNAIVKVSESAPRQSYNKELLEKFLDHAEVDGLLTPKERKSFYKYTNPVSSVSILSK